MAVVIDTRMEHEIHSRMSGLINQAYLKVFKGAVECISADLIVQEGFEPDDVATFLAGHLLEVLYK